MVLDIRPGSIHYPWHLRDLPADEVLVGDLTGPDRDIGLSLDRSRYLSVMMNSTRRPGCRAWKPSIRVDFAKRSAIVVEQVTRTDPVRPVPAASACRSNAEMSSSARSACSSKRWPNSVS